MACVISHCKDCKHFFKKDFLEIHEFLDEYSKIFIPAFFLDYHRTFLHNSYGMSLVKEMWGIEGYKAAMIHLTRDYVGATIDHWTMEKIETELFPKILMWFNKLSTEYNPKPHVIRNWNKTGLVAQAIDE